MLTVFLRRSLLLPEPGVVRRSRRMAQRQTPSPGSRSLGWGGTRCVHHVHPPSAAATVHVVPGGVTEPSPLPCEALDSCLRVAVTSHAEATDMRVLVTLEAGDQGVSRAGPIEAFPLGLQTAVFSLSSRGPVSGSQCPLLMRPPVTLRWGHPKDLVLT